MLKHRSLAKQIAWLTAKGMRMEYDDAAQIAQIGLIQAAKSFDSSKPMETFKSFAWKRIRGAIIDEARKNSFVPRLALARGERATMVSLDEVWDESGEPKIALGAYHADLATMIDFRDAFSTLTKREQYVLASLGEGARGREIASELGITESRVSQIATAARTKLKEKLEV